MRSQHRVRPQHRGRAWVAAGVLLVLGASLLVALPASGASPSRSGAKSQKSSKASLKPAAKAARKIEYWIGAVPTTWNVVPSGTDPMKGTTYDPDKSSLQAVIYRRYTPDWKNQLAPAGYGLVGPIIRAQAGDSIVVHFKNFDPNNAHSMHFHGVHYENGSDGAYIPGASGPGADVKPGQTYTYRFETGPDSVGVWPYYDHAPSMEDSIAAGMYGALSIRPKGQRKPDREFVVFFGKQLNFDTIDGLAFINNTPTFRAKVGDVVQWDVLSLGDDIHSFHVHGHRWTTSEGPRDVRPVTPGESFVLRWKEDKPGTWLYHCHVGSHMANGMVGLYVVMK